LVRCGLPVNPDTSVSQQLQAMRPSEASEYTYLWRCRISRLFPVLVVLCIAPGASVALGDAVVPGGTVSGTWKLADTIYLYRLVAGDFVNSK
jgi:hypothetical protein